MTHQYRALVAHYARLTALTLTVFTAAAVCVGLAI